ncbi:MAG: hypothetical protein CVU61_08945 [Deltaproteobacteria bacterium HGW-Deltaproteobacteria-19]|jgi:hypothetical protein|nr:MAG: hypothetical protein CVU61_08945 [Deltaproteobacteria bacterium HGW-Deltaproteobacteria-19]
MPAAIRKWVLVLLVLLLAVPAIAATVTLSRWVTLRSDKSSAVREIIRSEVDKREGFSTSQEEKANLNSAEDEKERDDSAYKKGIANANREFVRAKKKRDDLTSRYQAVFSEREEQQKNVRTTRAGIDNLDSQVARYNQDIQAQQVSLKKWLQTEKQGEAAVAVLFTRGFKDKAHTLEAMADQASAPLMAQYMGTYIQSFTKVINTVLSVDFIRAIEEGTAKWNNEEPLRFEMEKGAKGTTYLRLKRYELYPFQAPKGGRVKPPPASRNIRAVVVTSKKDLDNFLIENRYTPTGHDLERAYRMIRETTQMNATAEEGLQEQVKSYQDRIASLQKKIREAQSDKGSQTALLKRREEQLDRTAREATAVQSQKEEADQSFRNAQQALHDIKRVRESIIFKTALATARGSQTPAETSAEAIIDKLAEVRNDAKTQHSTSTTEVTNFTVSGESAHQAVTEARIISVRLISFINEGDSVRVKMAFRVRTVLEESADDGKREADRRPVERKPVDRKPVDRKPVDRTPTVQPPEKKEKDDGFLARIWTPSEPTREEKEKDVPPAKPTVKRNPHALGAHEGNDVLFELISVKNVGKDLLVRVDVTNMTEDATRYVALYDQAYRWTKSRVTDTVGKEHDVSEVTFWSGNEKTTMYSAGSRGVPLDGRTTKSVLLFFKQVPGMKSVRKLTIHPYVYYRKVFWSWQEFDFAFQNVRVSR